MYRSYLLYRDKENKGTITIWVNKNNTIFNILSIIIKCTDRIMRDCEQGINWELRVEPWFASHLREQAAMLFLHTKTITPNTNKYDSHMMVKLHRQINLIKDANKRNLHLHVYTIWLYIAVCCNHINDDVIDVSCSMGEKAFSVEDLQTRKTHKVTCVLFSILTDDLLSHINEIRNLHLYKNPVHKNGNPI